MRRDGRRLHRRSSAGISVADLTPVNIQAPNLPVGNKTPTSFGEAVQAITGGDNEAEFDYTSVATVELVPTTSSSAGMLQLAFLGSFAGDTNAVYTTGLSADMTISCIQPAPGMSLGCNGTIDTPAVTLPPAPLPEPAPLTLFGAALLGFSLLRAREQAIIPPPRRA